MITADDMNDMGYQYYEAEAKDVKNQTMVEAFRKAAGQPINPPLSTFVGKDNPLAMAWRLITEEYAELLEESERRLGEREDLMLKEMADLLYVLYGYASLRGWDLDEAFRRVHENNMGRMYQPDGTIKRREDGKIMKNPNYPKVDLKDLV